MNIGKINEKYCLHDCVTNKIEIRDSTLIMAQINSKLIELAIKGGLSGLQFGLKKLIGYGLNQIW